MSYKQILVAVDLTPSSQIVIEKAIVLAQSAKSKLTFVFVDVDDVVITPKEEQELETQLQALADNCGYPVEEALVVIGDLHIKLAGIAKERGTDLVVCGHHHKVLSKLFSSIPKLANAVEADLLVVYLE
ncbi:universal stress protein [Vibrio sp.]|uniref:universal stress protein n=1 Tax=Vibrio sp. TaxID=678 RepID=UPI003D0BDC0D